MVGRAVSVVHLKNIGVVGTRRKAATDDFKFVTSFRSRDDLGKFGEKT